MHNVINLFEDPMICSALASSYCKSEIAFNNMFSQGVSKGLVAEKIFTSMAENGQQADFVLCIGDDRSDEDMFEIIGSAISGNILSSNTSVFACTVGQKPSKAKYYLDDTNDVIVMLDSLANASLSPESSDAENDISP